MTGDETGPLPNGLENSMEIFKLKSERADAAGRHWQRRDDGISYQGVMKKRLRA
jgi:hypothetical protein